MPVVGGILNVLTEEGPLAVVLTALGFGLLVFIHELGHFMVAKFSGVKVLKFSLGFGPELIGFTKGETRYQLSMIPFGGYLKMAGEYTGLGPEGRPSKEPEPGDFFAKPPRVRAGVLAAGSVMNFLGAFPLLIVSFLFGVMSPLPIVEITPGYTANPAYVSGLRDGDRIVRVNDREITYWADLQIALILTPLDEPLEIHLQRQGRPVTVTLNRAEIYRARGEEPKPQLGLTVAASTRIDRVKSDTPAFKAGLRVGDRIVEVDGKKVRSWDHFRRIVKAQPETELRLTVSRSPSADGTGRELLSFQVRTGLVKRYGIGAACGAYPAIGDVQGGGPAARAGIRRGDEILRLGDRDARDWAVAMKWFRAQKGAEVTVVVERDEKRLTFTVQPEIHASGAYRLGVLYTQDATIGEIEKGSPAAKAGLQAGDVVQALWLAEQEKEGEEPPETKVRFWAQLVGILEGIGPKSVRLRVLRGEEEHIVTVTPREKAEPYGQLGVAYGIERRLRRYGLGMACQEGLRAGWKMTRLMFETLRALLAGRARAEVSGPIGIMGHIFQSARQGLGLLLYILAFLGINLAILNLLPIPILDGGHLLFLVIEKLRGKPVSEKAMAVAQYIGLALLLSLVLLATSNDLRRLFS